MWLLHLLPDSLVLWTVNIVLLLGAAATIAGFFVKFIPFVNQYRLPMQIGGIVMLCIGIYLKGGYGVEMTWRERVRELEAKVVVAEQKSKEANTVIETKVVTKIKVVKENVYVNREIIKEVAGKQLDASCSLPKSTISLHDSASRNEVAGRATATDGTASEVKASQLLDRVVENYGACYENAAKLEAWQQWYREQKKIFDSVK